MPAPVSASHIRTVTLAISAILAVILLDFLAGHERTRSAETGVLIAAHPSDSSSINETDSFREGGGGLPVHIPPARVGVIAQCTIRVLLLSATGEPVERREHSEQLLYRFVSAPQGPPRAAQVIAGVCTIALPGPTDADATKILVEGLLAGDRFATAVDGVLFQPGRSDHTVTVAFQSAWRVTVVASEDKVPLDGLSVIRARGSWVGAETAEPPANGVLVDSGVGPELELESAKGKVYWIGRQGYAWFPLRWERRHHIGHIIHLEAASSVVFECVNESTPTCAITLSQRVPRHGTTTIGTWRVDSAMNKLEPLRSGEYEMGVSYGGLSTVVDWSCTIKLDPGQVHYVTIPCSELVTSVTVDLAVDTSAGPGALEGDWGLIRIPDTAIDGVSYDWPEQVPDIVVGRGMGWRLSWANVVPGLYVVRVREALWAVRVVGDSPVHKSVRYSDPKYQEIHFVHAQTGVPAAPPYDMADVTFVMWSALCGEDSQLPAGRMLPASGRGIAPSGDFVISSPCDVVNLVFSGPFGFRMERVSLSSYADGHAIIEIEPIYKMRLSVCGLEGPPSLGWWGDVGFERDGRMVEPEDVLLTVNTESSGMLVTGASYQVLGGRPLRVFLPHRGRGEWGWRDIPTVGLEADEYGLDEGWH